MFTILIVLEGKGASSLRKAGPLWWPGPPPRPRGVSTRSRSPSTPPPPQPFVPQQGKRHRPLPYPGPARIRTLDLDHDIIIIILFTRARHTLSRVNNPPTGSRSVWLRLQLCNLWFSAVERKRVSPRRRQVKDSQLGDGAIPISSWTRALDPPAVSTKGGRMVWGYGGAKRERKHPSR